MLSSGKYGFIGSSIVMVSSLYGTRGDFHELKKNMRAFLASINMVLVNDDEST